MEILVKQVGRAHRRLTWQLFFRCLAWCWCGALLLAAFVVTADWYWQWKLAPWTTSTQNAGVADAIKNYDVVDRVFVVSLALVAGLLAAIAITFSKRTSRMDAAIELDRRFGLRERVSSTLALGATELETEAGQALADDAVRRVKNVHVGEHFNVRFGRWTLAPILPAAVLACLMLLLPAPKPAEASVTPEKVGAKTKKSANRIADLKKKWEQKKADMDKAQLPEANKELFEKFERGIENVKNAPDKKEALAKLNELAEELQKKRDAQGGAEQLKEQLKAMKGMNDGPADKLSQALKEGDLDKAKKELDKLKEKMNDNSMSPEDRQKLADQLGSMQQKMEKMAQAAEGQRQSLEKQLEQAKASGNKGESQKLQQQLEKLAQQGQKMEQMKGMAQKLGDASKAMKEGKTGEAMAKLQELQEELGDLQEELEKLDALDEALGDLEGLKDQMLNDLANKDGQGDGQDGQGDGEGDQPGDGLGRGQGIGDRPEEKTDYSTTETKAKGQQHKGGKSVVIGDAKGPNQKGDVLTDITAAIEAGKSDDSDPTQGQPLPKAYKEHAKKYFESIREGK